MTKRTTSKTSTTIAAGTPKTHYVRFLSLSLEGLVGDEALDTVTSTYQDDDLKESTPIDKVEDQRSVPNLGGEAKIIYGTQDDGCRLARLVLRNQNAVADASYGGCHLAGSGDTIPSATAMPSTA